MADHPLSTTARRLGLPAVECLRPPQRRSQCEGCVNREGAAISSENGPRLSHSRNLSIRICIQHRAQGLLEVSEPGFEGSPAADAQLVDRAPDLGSAGCPDSPVVLIETKASLLKRHANIVEQLANFRFRALE